MRIIGGDIRAGKALCCWQGDEIARSEGVELYPGLWRFRLNHQHSADSGTVVEGAEMIRASFKHRRRRQQDGGREKAELESHAVRGVESPHDPLNRVEDLAVLLHAVPQMPLMRAPSGARPACSKEGPGGTRSY